ncbi:MAG: haloacid dehalogenase-like hydrolase [Flavobacteriales bacterium]|nr:haloacid dehalogenase-like hydrolase [Flavobacteriales bacterium]
MVLFMFDIDGTLLDSTGVDDACFVQSFQDIFDFNIEGFDWNQVSEVTDDVLAREVYASMAGKPLTEELYHKFKNHFISLLNKEAEAYPEKFSKVPGALEFMQVCLAHPGIAVSVATGSWKESGLLKLKMGGFEKHNLTFASCSDFPSRRNIARTSLMRACLVEQMEFSNVVYFGDGLWDYKTMQSLDWNFIGIDVHENGKLKAAGAEQIINHYLDAQEILQPWL